MEINKLTIKELKECIIKGKIKLSNGSERKFDLLDFYLMSNYKPIPFLREVRKISKSSEFDKIKVFFLYFERMDSNLRHASAN